MALMWPRKIPAEILRNPSRSAECEVYRRLEAQLGDRYVVFYSRPWLGLTAYGEEIDGECDFVVCHPDKGLLAIEVKGGAISYDPMADKWTSRDRHGFRHNIRNPVQQARSSKHQLLAKLHESAAWKRRFVRARHGIIFPHSSQPAGDLGADMPLKIFCFRGQFPQLGRWVESRLADAEDSRSDEKSLGADGMLALERILAMPFQLHSPLAYALSDDDRAIVQLTHEQFHILEMISDVQRAAIAGAAGTGKTILAIEEARRSAERGSRTLYTCFNRALSAHVSRVTGNQPGLEVAGFHAMCARMAREAGLTIPVSVPERTLHEEILPDLLAKAAHQRPDLRFDSVIVDEGQDFKPLWWIALDTLLQGSANGRLRIFYDSNQRVYADASALPHDVQMVPIRLTWNLRNTQRIHEVVARDYQGFSIRPLGPEGTQIQIIALKPSMPAATRLVSLLTELTVKEEIAYRDIAVLAEDETSLAPLLADRTVQKMKPRRCDEAVSDGITVDTIRRFKGLENKVVIVHCGHAMHAGGELRYVACSRARTHLILLSSRPELLQQWATAR